MLIKSTSPAPHGTAIRSAGLRWKTECAGDVVKMSATNDARMAFFAENDGQESDPATVCAGVRRARRVRVCRRGRQALRDETQFGDREDVACHAGPLRRKNISCLSQIGDGRSSLPGLV